MTHALDSNARIRRYDICMSLNMTNLSIELERLERLGISKNILARWKDRGKHLLDDILDVSDSLEPIK